jgi:hypothetical protein
LQLHFSSLSFAFNFCLLKTDHDCPMCYYYSEHSWPCQKMLLAYSQMWGLLTLVQKRQEGVQSVCFCIPLHHAFLAFFFYSIEVITTPSVPTSCTPMCLDVYTSLCFYVVSIFSLVSKMTIFSEHNQVNV